MSRTLGRSKQRGCEDVNWIQLTEQSLILGFCEGGYGPKGAIKIGNINFST
jgi:hypothetical protein